MLELIMQRIQEFIFILYAKDKVYSIIIMDDRYKDLFNNNMHITLQEFELSKEDDMIFSFPIYARLRFKQHYAIPFCLQAEPFPLYKVLADYAYSSSNNNNNNNVLTLIAVYSNDRREPLDRLMVMNELIDEIMEADIYQLLLARSLKC
jgi:hypothetical protein